MILRLPAWAYRPKEMARPNAWNWHLSRCTDGCIKTVCGLTLGEVETLRIAYIPPGGICKSCLGAIEEVGEDKDE